MTTKPNVVSNLATRHEKIAEGMRKIAEILGEFPELEEELAAAYSGETMQAGTNGHAVDRPIGARRNRTPDETGAPTKLETLADFFVKNGNVLTATPSLSELSGLDRNQVINVLWSSRGKKVFEKHKHPKDGKMKMWRLKPEEFETRKPKPESN